MVFCVLETITNHELFVCPVTWFVGNDLNNGIIHYPSDTKNFLKYQCSKDKLPEKSWMTEPARLFAKYSEYELAVRGMYQLLDGHTLDGNRWKDDRTRRVNSAEQNMSTIQYHANPVQRSYPTNTFDSIVVDPVCHNNEIETNSIKSEFVENNKNNNIVFEIPEITNRLDKIERDMAVALASLSNMEVSINKLMEAVSKIGTTISSSDPYNPVANSLENSFSLTSMLPIKDHNEFMDFETTLRDKTYYEKFVMEMATYGGRSGERKGYKIAYGLIDQIFTREFLTTCSWTGSSKNNVEKNSFSSATKFLEAFFEIVHLADSRYTKNDAKEFFKEKILRNANSRLKNLQHKQTEEPTKKRRRMVKSQNDNFSELSIATIPEPPNILEVLTISENLEQL